MAGSGRTLGAALVGVGMAVPQHVVSNAEIAERLGVDEEWISRRTGTKVRHVASPGERLEHLAAGAARSALEDAGLDPVEVDLVLVGTTSAEEMSPHAAPLVAADIGTKGAGAIDVSAACPGFLSCLALGASMIEAGRARTVVAIGADMLSRYLDPDDRGSAMLFGDGAGAVVLTGVDGPTQVESVCLHSDGDGRALIRLDRDERLIRMDGPTVFRYAVRCMTDVTREVLDEVGATTQDVDLFVYHQANTRIIDAVGKRLHLDPAKVVNVIEEYANTSAASLPIALAAARARGRLPDGSRVLLSAFGAGMVWGGAILRWGRPA
ncbi:3-oxoacyl-ACP synthase III family protein [Leekyejoonella antrihumi]|uniref:Beta-ketoacyl-ACP synthase III n=1 Tax=Leekyejoonella antrihumi TaxID=1660198 RepID=A0A563E1D3_9MICO|nr:beta-ketoacyl-ACP synthase 3 [Leekyejoonella antrihumi]TWP36327.1 beta-ketoacyl-ACP synthase III [Leekyejoonella antrihumi]